MKSRARQYWLAIHLYCGLILGIIFTLLGITGSILVFYPGIDEALNPEIQVHHVIPAPPSAKAVLRTLRQNFPERNGPWRIEMPMTSESPVTARYYKPVEKLDNFFAPLMVTIDPVTLSITSHRFWGDYAMTWIYDLHFTLLLGKEGRTAIGVLGLFTLMSLISGLYLWWPSRQRLFTSLKPHLRKGVARRTYDLHVLSGVYSWLVLTLVVLTGSALALPGYTKDILNTMVSFQSSEKIRKPEELKGKGIDLDSAVSIAKSHFPMAEVRWVQSSGVDNKPIIIRLHQSHEPSRRFPRTKVWLHPQTGEVLDINNPIKNKTGDSILAWLYPLHNGEAFGMTGRIIIFISGLVMSLLFVTGLIRWRQKIRAAIAYKNKK